MNVPEQDLAQEFSQRDVRSLIFHLLYAAESHEYEVSLQSIVDNFNRGFDLSIPFDSELVKKAQAIIDERNVLDDLVKPFLINWRFERIGVSTKLILRFAIWEVKHTDIPTNIIINEAIELAKCFAEKDAYKFINGILDNVVQALGREAAEPAAAEE